jgi:quinol monooxygenase YgiN
MGRTRQQVGIAAALAVIAVEAWGSLKETDMVVEYIRYEVPPDKHDEFVAGYKSAGRDLEASSHCLKYEIAEGVEEPNNFVVRIEWDSLEGHEKGFRSSPQMAPFFQKVKPFYAMIKEMKHYSVKGTGKK